MISSALRELGVVQVDWLLEGTPPSPDFSLLALIHCLSSAAVTTSSRFTGKLRGFSGIPVEFIRYADAVDYVMKLVLIDSARILLLNW